MSIQHATAASGSGGISLVAAPISRARVRIVAAALALGSGAVAVILLWHPGPERNDLSYASLAPVRDSAWTAAIVDHLGFTIAAFTLGVAVCLLTPARGAMWANLGAVLTAIGGTLFAGGVVAYGVLGWYVTAIDAIPAEYGTALMTYFADNPTHAIGPQATGFLLFNLGTLVLAYALWRATAVPRWLPIAWAVLTAGQFLDLPGRMLDFTQVAIMAIFIAVAWFAAKAADPAR